MSTVKFDLTTVYREHLLKEFSGLCEISATTMKNLFAQGKVHYFFRSFRASYYIMIFFSCSTSISDFFFLYGLEPEQITFQIGLEDNYKQTD